MTDGGRRSVVSGQKTADDGRQTADGRRRLAVSSRQSAVGGRQSVLRLSGLAILVLILGLVLARATWLPLIGGFLIVSDPLVPADAILVLGGGRRSRAEEGARLYHDGYASLVVVADSPIDVPGIRSSYVDLMKSEMLWQGVLEEHILAAPGLVTTTHEEALAVRQLAEARDWHSLIVVTDPYHTRRARWVFRDVFADTAITVTVRPARQHSYAANTWWQNWNGLRDAWIEYPKLVVHLLGYR